MKFMLKNHLETAQESLQANRLRTFLTITGVTIGVTSIVAILSLTSGATNIIAEQVDGMNGNLAVIRPGSAANNSLEGAANSLTHRSTTTSSLSLSDADRLEEVKSIKNVAPLTTIHASVKSDTANINALILGSTANLFPMSNLDFYSGGFESESKELVAIGAQLSVELFGTEESIGKLVNIKGNTYRISGVLHRQTTPINFNGIDFDNAVMANQSIVNQLDSRAQVQQINLQAGSVTELEAMVTDAKSTMLSAHSDEQDFHILTGTDISAPTSQLFNIITGVTATIAAIALFVGGIGIMNIMLVNVSERSHEIGIRKALGATNSDIVWQFLIESIIMALIGGLLGLFFGLLFAFCISLFLSFNPVVTWQIAVTAGVVSLVIGSLFGFYPAYRAARKNPIDSLSQAG